MLSDFAGSGPWFLCIELICRGHPLPGIGGSPASNSWTTELETVPKEGKCPLILNTSYMMKTAGP